jgi:hypothetical protein
MMEDWVAGCVRMKIWVKIIDRYQGDQENENNPMG